MYIKHSKFKNTGILFEILVKKITSDTLSGKTSKAIKIIKEYFVNTELGKEYKLYETMFKGLTPVEFLKITKVAEWKKFNTPLPIITQGKPVKDLILIYNGTVDVLVNDNKVAELKDGQFVGEMSFLTEKPATATCKVEHNAECLVWPQQDFKDLLKRNPSLYFTIQSLLSEQVSNNLVSSSQK